MQKANLLVCLFQLMSGRKLPPKLKKPRSGKNIIFNSIKKGMKQVEQIENGRLKSISLKQWPDKL